MEFVVTFAQLNESIICTERMLPDVRGQWLEEEMGKVAHEARIFM